MHIRTTWKRVSANTFLILIMCVPAFAGAPAYTAPADTAVTIQAGVKPSEGAVGTVFDYTVTVSGRGIDKLRITLPPAGDVFPGKDAETNGKNEPGREVVPVFSVEKAWQDTAGQADGSMRFHVQLAYFRPGTYRLPELDIRDTDGIAVGYKIPGVVIKSLNPAGTLQDIDPPFEMPRRWTGIIIAALVLVALGTAVFFVVRNLVKKKRERPAPEPLLTPLEIFTRDIESMRCAELIRDGRAKDYALAVSFAFRGFLAGMFNVDAREMTTEELRPVLKRRLAAAHESRRFDDIMGCFNLWDLSRYAEFAPSREILENNLALTRKLADMLYRGESHV